MTELPILSRLSDDEVKDCVKNNMFQRLENYPCHTQKVEQCVKLVTEASALVCGIEAPRDGLVQA